MYCQSSCISLFRFSASAVALPVKFFRYGLVSKKIRLFTQMVGFFSPDSDFSLALHAGFSLAFAGHTSGWHQKSQICRATNGAIQTDGNY